jgi:hypothetical protein
MVCGDCLATHTHNIHTHKMSGVTSQKTIGYRVTDEGSRVNASTLRDNSSPTGKPRLQAITQMIYTYCPVYRSHRATSRVACVARVARVADVC